MAFENVFGNVDFRLPVQAAQAEQARFDNLLGGLVDAYKYKQGMDLRKKELENRGNNIDLGKAAQLEVLKMKQGLPYDENVINAYSDFKGSQTYIDPATGYRVQTDPLSKRLGIDQPAPMQPTTVDPNSFAAMGVVDPVTNEQLTTAPPVGGAPMPMPPVMSKDDFLAAKAEGYAGSPMESKKAGEAVIDINKAAQETYVKEKAKEKAGIEAKLNPIKSALSLMEQISQEDMQAAPSGGLQGIGADISSFVGAPSEAAIAGSSLDVKLPFIFSETKRMVRDAGEGTFTDADAKAIQGINFAKDDPYEIKVKKYNELKSVLERAAKRIDPSFGKTAKPTREQILEELRRRRGQ